jgi:uncharacterized protein YkwD
LPSSRLVKELTGRTLIDREVSMARSKFRRSLRFENLESRELLSSGGPTDQQQYMLQFINEARTDPAAAAQRATSNITPDIQATLQYYGVNLSATEQAIASATPQPPVAWNPALADAAQAHSQDMANNGFQSHTGSDGSSPGQRMQQAGYSNVSSRGENAFAYAKTVDDAMQAFLIDWGVANQGHRANLLQPGVSAQDAYRDVGIGIASTSSDSSVGPTVVTQDFGARPNSQAQVVGAAYYDNSGDGFYEPGEGQGGVQIDAVNLKTGQVTSTQTWDAGGYEIGLAPGQYCIIASVNDAVVKTVNVTIGNLNIAQDFILSDPWQGGTREAAIAAAQPAPVVQVATPPTAAQPAPVVRVTTPPAAVQPSVVLGSMTPDPMRASAATPLGMAWTTWSAGIR